MCSRRCGNEGSSWGPPPSNTARPSRRRVNCAHNARLSDAITAMTPEGDTVPLISRSSACRLQASDLREEMHYEERDRATRHDYALGTYQVPSPGCLRGPPARGCPVR